MFKNIVPVFTLFACLSCFTSSSFAMLGEKEEQDEETLAHLTQSPQKQGKYVSINGLQPIYVLRNLWLCIEERESQFWR